MSIVEPAHRHWTSGTNMNDSYEGTPAAKNRKENYISTQYVKRKL